MNLVFEVRSAEELFDIAQEFRELSSERREKLMSYVQQRVLEGLRELAEVDTLEKAQQILENPREYPLGEVAQ